MLLDLGLAVRLLVNAEQIHIFSVADNRVSLD